MGKPYRSRIDRRAYLRKLNFMHGVYRQAGKPHNNKVMRELLHAYTASIPRMGNFVRIPSLTRPGRFVEFAVGKSIDHRKREPNQATAKIMNSNLYGRFNKEPT